VFRVVQHWGCPKGRHGVSILVASLAVALTGLACNCGPEKTGWTLRENWRESGFANKCKTQVLFYSPPGASVTVRDPARTHDVAPEPAYGARLEHTPEEESVFNLYPGHYEFKYTSVEGVPGVSIYGELEVKCVCGEMARKFQRLAYVPISLPSEHYRQVEVIGNEIYPYRGEMYRTAIDENDLARLRAGDVVEKVFVVADLEAAEKARRKLEQEIAVAERRIEYTDARFRDAYLDFRAGPTESACLCCPFLGGGRDKQFIHWQEEQVEQQQKLDRLQARLQRVNALLKADTVCTREGMLLVATCEVVKGHDDPDDAADKIGEVLVVMRVGGRHMHWGEPGRELAGYEPAH
jgi:hypothetical protein